MSTTYSKDVRIIIDKKAFIFLPSAPADEEDKRGADEANFATFASRKLYLIN